MPSQTHSTLDSGPSTPHSDDEVLVRVEGVSKKFCRSLKKSLWYGVCDIAGELLPGRKRQRVAGSELLVAGEEEAVAGSELLVASEEEEVAGSGLLVASENTSAEGASGLVTSHSPPVTRHSAEGAPPATSYPPLVTSPTGEASLRDGEFFAVKDVSFELRRGECLGLIGHNGAGNQAAGLLLVESYGSERQPLGPRQPGGCTGDCRKAARRVRRVGTSESTLPKAARRVRRRGKARINTTLLKMLNGLIKPDQGSITMRGRVRALIALGAGFYSLLIT